MKRSLTRRRFLKATGLAAGYVAMPTALPAGPAAAGKPNVILVMTDDQGYGDLACHGNKVIRTPSLDGLYGRSVRLTDFHVAPLCTPTRAQLMTGRDAVRTGAWGTTWGRSLPRRELATMADVFAAAGYRTGHFGKWHLGDNYPYRPEDRGFQEVLRHGGGGVGQTPDYWGNDYFDDTYCHNGKWTAYTGYCTDVWFGEAMKFIEANRDRPFFCYVPTNAPHGPYLVAGKYKDMYKAAGGRSAAFYGMITNIDDNMARLDRKLKDLGLVANTILIFTTDNGSSAGTHAAGLRGRKGSLYDGGHRVPCFIRWPAGGLTGPRDLGELTCCQDLLPTLISLCGLTRPKEAKFDGIDISPLLRGTTDSLPERMLVVQYSQTASPPPKWRSTVMFGRWRLVLGNELYDVRADPGQKNDVAAGHGDVVAKMRDHYERWWSQVSRRFGEMSHVVIGSDRADPVRLTGFDWHARTPWNQSHVRRGAGGSGFWAVEVERDGTYQFALRRWPEEVNRPVAASDGAGGRALPIAKARLKLAGVDRTAKVRPEDVAATFTVKLSAGKTKLQTSFLNEKGKELCGAYYVYVKRL